MAWARNLKVPLSAVNARKPKISPGIGPTLAVLTGYPQHVSGPIIVHGAAGDEQKIGQAVHILNGRSADRLLRVRGEFHHHPFRPATYGAGEMQVCGGGGAAWQHKRGQRREMLVQAVDVVLEPFDLA